MKFMATVLAIALAYLLLLAAIFLAQDRLLYFPERISVQRVASDRLRAWPSAQEFRGLVAEPAGTARATALVFHGNAGHAGRRDYYVRALLPLGLRVILAEYPGYGPRTGALSEASLVADAGETVALAHSRYGGPLLVMGESLGAAVAVAAAAAHPDRASGLLLVTPWDRLANVGAHHYPWLPVRWLLRDEYDSAARLAAFDGPVVVAVAERDSIVPARFGTALYHSIAGPKELLVIAGSDHNDWPDRVDARWWRDVIAKFLGKVD
ncbi:alpha/beta hydrolase [Ramlibacter sp. AN1015]|uniref:alpha/beta hydrolase n=1 Tax=Ramlibacter sp. AN1015 TaxID=3133428 RepID=UPI0030BEE0EB